MQTIEHWLHNQKAADIMASDVQSLKPTDSLAAAAKLFVDNQISGAPVVDQDGFCVGVLTVTDLMAAHRACDGQVARSQTRWQAFEEADPGMRRWQELALLCDPVEQDSEKTVGRHMTADIVSVLPETSLEVVIRRLIDAHVHRVLVLDAPGRLCGMITTTDVLAALLRAST